MINEKESTCTHDAQKSKRGWIKSKKKCRTTKSRWRNKDRKSKKECDSNRRKRRD